MRHGSRPTANTLWKMKPREATVVLYSFKEWWAWWMAQKKPARWPMRWSTYQMKSWKRKASS
jgi:hypothetical protein